MKKVFCITCIDWSDEFSDNLTSIKGVYFTREHASKELGRLREKYHDKYYGEINESFLFEDREK